MEPVDAAKAGLAHAGPSVRRFARELGVDLSAVTGSGPKGRILREDVQTFVKTELTRFAGGVGGIGFNLPPLPQVDFAKFGAVQMQPLSRIKKLSGANLHRNWLSIPHVTQHDEADITELEAFRKSQADEAKKEGIRFTLLAFLIKAVVVALKQYPNFNASLSSDGENLILKQYFNIGVAVDTPLGLVVPVMRDADKKGLRELAKELGDVSSRMRDGKINPADLQGGCFSISSLGGIGGTHVHADHQCAGSGDPRRRQVGHQAGMGWQAVRAAADAAVVAVVRSPRDRRRAGRALHRVSEQRAVRYSRRLVLVYCG